MKHSRHSFRQIPPQSPPSASSSPSTKLLFLPPPSSKFGHFRPFYHYYFASRSTFSSEVFLGFFPLPLSSSPDFGEFRGGNFERTQKTLAQYFFPFLRGTTFAAWIACLRRKLPGTTLYTGGMIRNNLPAGAKQNCKFSSALFSFYSKVIDPFFRCRNFRELLPGFAAATSPVVTLTARSLTPCSVLIREKE